VAITLYELAWLVVQLCAGIIDPGVGRNAYARTLPPKTILHPATRPACMQPHFYSHNPAFTSRPSKNKSVTLTVVIYSVPKCVYRITRSRGKQNCSFVCAFAAFKKNRRDQTMSDHFTAVLKMEQKVCVYANAQIWPVVVVLSAPCSIVCFASLQRCVSNGPYMK
jgi:hypothetical protein